MSIGRKPTAREILYLERCVQSDLKMLKGVFWFLMVVFGAFYVFAAYLLTVASSHERPAIFGAIAIMLLITIPLMKYLWRRAQRRIPIDGEIRTVSGAYRTERRGQGKTTRFLHFIGDQCVSLPGYWGDHYAKDGDYVEGEGYLLYQVGIDRALHPDMMLILGIEGRAIIDEDVGRGLLSIKGPAMWLAALISFSLAIFFLGIPEVSAVSAPAAAVGIVFGGLAIRRYRFNKKLIDSLRR